MAEIVLFGGTSEGRALALLLREKNIHALVCVATEYGEALLEAGGSVRVRAGRLDEAGITLLLAEEGSRTVIDATHPYAALASGNIKAACAACGAQYIRVLRERSADEGCVGFADMDALVDWLNGREGVIFSTLGAKEAAALTRVRDYRDRVWLRVLPALESLSACLAAGYPAKHIVCMQGPFSKEINAAMFRASGAAILLTKESGAAGGFLEKLEAAWECEMTVAVLARPKEEEGLTLEQIMRRIEDDAL